MYPQSGVLNRGGTRILSWIDAHRPLTAALFSFGIMSLFFLYLYYATITGEFRAGFAVDHLPAFFAGMQLTLVVTVLGFSVGIVLGFMTAAARVSEVRALKAVAKGFVDAFRGTPILVQIFLWNVVITAFTPGLRVQSLIAGIIALTINTGAYQAEIFRGGFKAIQQGQVEAGRAVGFTSWQVMRHIKLPQTLRLIIPPMTNEFILLLKASALLSAISIVELSFVAQQLGVRFFLPVETWTVATFLYLSMTVPLAKLVQYMETKFRIPGLGLPIVGAMYPRRIAPGPSASAKVLPSVTAFSRQNGLYASLRRRMENAPRSPKAVPRAS